MLRRGRARSWPVRLDKPARNGKPEPAALAIAAIVANLALLAMCRQATPGRNPLVGLPAAPANVVRPERGPVEHEGADD